MPANRIKKAVSWLPYALTLGIAILLGLSFWQGRIDWREWKFYTEGPVQLAHLPPGAIAWKQPVAPAQYEQASCGACHREDLAQTPRLNHGRQLIARYNCIGCHQLQDIDRPSMLGPDLTSVGTKVDRRWIYKWLKDPRTLTDADGNVTVDGVATNPRMPKFHLSDQELRALSAYLSAQKAQPVAPYRFNHRLVASVAKQGDAADHGQIRFNQMFCVTCHALAVDRGGETSLIGGDIGPELTKVGSKVNPDWLAAWLRDPQGYLQHTRMPQYQWSDQDMYEVTQYILKRLTDPDLFKDIPQMGPPTGAEVRLGEKMFVSKGCAECHAIQGVTPESSFGPSLSALGMSALPSLVDIRLRRKNSTPLHFATGNPSRLDILESRVPRFQIAYIQAKVLNPASVSYGTHMPRYSMGKADLDDVTTALLSMVGPPLAVAAQRPLIVPRHHAEFHPDGQFGQLYERYRCDTCHAFNGYGGTLAPDLSYEGSRAQRDWLVQFLKNPQTLRPTLTVRMPELNMTDKDAAIIADYLSTSLRNAKVNPVETEKAFTPEMAASGKHLYETKYQCQSCHTIGSAGGYVGPSLNNAGNWLTPVWIEAWLRNPQALVPETIEPRHTFTEDEIRDLTAYLLTLKEAPASDSTTGAAKGGGE